MQRERVLVCIGDSVSGLFAFAGHWFDNVGEEVLGEGGEGGHTQLRHAGTIITGYPVRESGKEREREQEDSRRDCL